MHADGTLDAIMQINYDGNVEDFAWVVPAPNVPQIDVVNSSLIRELDQRTAPVYIAPPKNCARLWELPFFLGVRAGAPPGGGVNVLGQGEVGPFNYVTIGSSNPTELLAWLRSNGYRVSAAAEPIIDAYVKEQMVFVAIKLKAQQTIKDIQPVKLTYRATQPMLPMRIASVAAHDDMALNVWILGAAQAEPENYRAMTLDESQLLFSRNFSGRDDNYHALVARTVNWNGGRAFVTEFAGPTAKLAVGARDADLRKLLSQHAYLTRFYTRISPAEMTVDPVFRFNPSLLAVSNVHDLSQAWRVWDCAEGVNRAASPVEYYLYTATLNLDPLCLACYGIMALGTVSLISFARRKRTVL